MPQHRVRFLPFGKTVTVPDGATLLEAAARARIGLDSPCGGDGICGRCKLIVREGKVAGETSALLTREEIRRGFVLACQTTARSDVVVEIPEESRARELITLDADAQRFRAESVDAAPPEFPRAPLVDKAFLKLAPPTLTDNLSDCERLQTEIVRKTGIETMQAGLKVIRRFAAILRDSDYAVTALLGRRAGVAEVMDIEGGDTSARNFIAVVDIGTTTVVCHLVNASAGETVGAQACFNSQSAWGREVTSRMIAVEREGGRTLQELIVGDVNRLILALCTSNGVGLGEVTAVVCAGNTAMIHFLLDLPTSHIRREPYVAVTTAPPPLRAAEVGLRINPRGLLYALPGVGGWVGADVVAGVLASGLDEMDEMGMLIDVGTNGEVVIGNREWLMACSASAGPALEGASVECGMMAERGAIEKVESENGRLVCDVIGGGAPLGLCGSAIIDLIALLLERRIINRAGQFVDGSDPALRFEDGMGRFTLVSARESPRGREVFLSQEDIDNVVTAKAAIFAAAKIMLDRLGLAVGDVKRLFLAGGFGSRINVRHAVALGLLPDLPPERVTYVGNTSILGARLAALSIDAFDRLQAIARRTTYYDLMGTHDYVEQFQQARFLPHTNIELFPSQAQREVGG